MLTAPPVAHRRDAVPPEVWERVLVRWQHWCEGHPRSVCILGRVRAVASWACVALTLVAMVAVPGAGEGLRIALWLCVAVALYLLLARTRTVRLSTVLMLFGLGVPWALIVAWVTLGVSHGLGMSPTWDGASIALAAFVEEPGKLVPLAVLAVLAPGRVRRFAATDWHSPSGEDALVAAGSGPWPREPPLSCCRWPISPPTTPTRACYGPGKPARASLWSSKECGRWPVSAAAPSGSMRPSSQSVCRWMRIAG
jgi:hypothetical protein